MSEETIHPEMTIESIFNNFPTKSQRLAQAMTNSGLHCTSCSAASWESLEAGMQGHGMSDIAQQELIAELNAILAEEIDETTISMTPRAAEKFQSFAEAEGKKGAALRFGDSSGGCGGFQYILDFSEKPESDDEVFESNGVEVHVKKEALGRLLGSTIDFVDGLQGAGFKVSNPNVSRSCGCGNSQSY